MIRTNVVTLSTVKGVAYRQKLTSGGSGIVILREGAKQPGIASVSKTSGEAIPAANTPGDLYPKEAFAEALALTAGLPYKKQGSVQLKGSKPVEEPAPKTDDPEEIFVSGADYEKVISQYTDKNGKLSYALLNKDMMKFAHSSSIVRKMLSGGASQDEIVCYVTGAKFRSITKNNKLTNEQVAKILELLDEVSEKGVLKEFKEDIRRSRKSKK